ncbi:MAG: hypothetical protein LIP08_09735 [Bacteroides sp.]|nr:hypothetical protein [Bacteroides sp.]
MKRSAAGAIDRKRCREISVVLTALLFRVQSAPRGGGRSGTLPDLTLG